MLGKDAPLYEEGQSPLAFLQELVQWGSRPGASLDGWVQLHENTPVVDLGVLHRAECFPHRWPVPLTAASVDAANQCAAAGDPAALLREAVAACAPGKRQQFGSGGGGEGSAAAGGSSVVLRSGAASRGALSGSLKRKQPSPAVPVAAAAPPPPPPPQQHQQQQYPPPPPPPQHQQPPPMHQQPPPQQQQQNPPPPQQQLQQQQQLQLQGDPLLLEQLGVLKPLLVLLRTAAGLDLVTASTYRSIFLHRMSPIVRGEEVDILEELVAGEQLAAAAVHVRAAVE